MREANESKKNGTVLRWCSIREALAPTRRRKFRRIHGLEAPLHPQQVIGWLVILLIAVNTFAVLTPMLDPNLRPILSAVIGGVFLTHLLSHLTVLLLDPADPQVRGQPTNKVIPEFDRRKHPRVIENGRCHLCDILVTGKRTKHCSICVISAILSALLVAGLSGTEVLLAVLRDRRSDRPSPSNVTRFEHSLATIPPDPTDPTDQIPGPASLAALSLLGGLSAVVALLLIHLCLFHGYLACLGLTTYEYIREKRQRERTVLASNVPPIAASATLSSLPSASTMRIEPLAYVHPRERPVDAESTIPSNPRASSRCFARVHRLCGNFAGRSCLVRVDPSKEMGQARTNSPIPSEERAEDSLGCVRHMGRSVDAFLGSTDRRRPPSGRLSLPNLSLEVPLRPPKKCSPPDSLRASPSFLSQQSTSAVTKTRRRTARSRSRRSRDFRLSPILEAELSATLDSPQPTSSPSAVGSRSSYRASPGRSDPPEGKSLSA